MRTLRAIFPPVFLVVLVAIAISAQQQWSQSPAQVAAAQQAATQPQPALSQAQLQQPASAAQPDQSAQKNDSPALAVPVPSTAPAPEAENVHLRPVEGELEKKLDSKSAKPGDAVVVKTTENATIADGIEIPKGSRIIGRVTDVQAHSDTNPNARVTLQFDKAQLKSGQTLPIRTVLESVAPAEVTVHPTETLEAPSAMSAPGQDAGAPGGAMAGSRPGSPTATPPAGGAASAPSVAGGVPAVSPGTQEQAANAKPKVGTVVARQGNVAIKTTSIPGVLLAANADGKPFSNAAGALLGAKQNVHLDGGTEIVLAVMDAAPHKPGTK